MTAMYYRSRSCGEGELSFTEISNCLIGQFVALLFDRSAGNSAAREANTYWGRARGSVQRC
jgi:hypothetical protein